MRSITFLCSENLTFLMVIIASVLHTDGREGLLGTYVGGNTVH